MAGESDLTEASVKIILSGLLIAQAKTSSLFRLTTVLLRTAHQPAVNSRRMVVLLGLIDQVLQWVRLFPALQRYRLLSLPRSVQRHE